MAQQGWIKLYRQIQDSPIYLSEQFCRNMAWIDLLLLANHSPGSFRCRGILVPVNRGQVGMSVENLALRWKWSRGKAERFLKELEIAKQIVRQKDNVTTLITIVKYDDFQKDDKANSKAGRKANAKANDNPDEHQTGINNNEENNKEGKEVGIAHTPEELQLWQAFTGWMKQKAPRVMSMSEPLTIDQFLRLREKYGREKLGSLILEMQNYKGLDKKVSANLTFRKWADKQAGDTAAEQSDNPYAGMSEKEKSELFKGLHT